MRDGAPIPADVLRDDASAKFKIYDPLTDQTTHMLSCDGCGTHVRVSPQEYERYDSTFCYECARRQH